MGKPQFRRLTYDLYERLEGARLAGSTFQIILVIIDYTIGYRKDEASISLTRFQDKTLLSRQSVINAIKDAERRQIIRVNRQGTNPKTGTLYAINWHLSEWVVWKLPRTSKPELTSTSEGQSTIASKEEVTSTSKADLTSELVKGTLPDWSSGVDQTSQHLSFATPIERNYKVTLRNGSTTTPVSPSLDDGLTTPPLAGKSDKDRVLDYLQGHGRCQLRRLSDALGIRYLGLKVHLTHLKKAGLVNNPERGKWEAVGV